MTSVNVNHQPLNKIISKMTHSAYDFKGFRENHGHLVNTVVTRTVDPIDSSETIDIKHHVGKREYHNMDLDGLILKLLRQNPDSGLSRREIHLMTHVYIEHWERYTSQVAHNLIMTTDYPHLVYEVVAMHGTTQFGEYHMPTGLNLKQLVTMTRSTAKEYIEATSHRTITLQMMRHGEIVSIDITNAPRPERLEIVKQDYFDNHIFVRTEDGHEIKLTLTRKQDKLWLNEMREDAVGTFIQVTHNGLNAKKSGFNQLKILNVGILTA